VNEHDNVTCVECPVNTLSDAGSTKVSQCLAVSECEKNKYRNVDEDNNVTRVKFPVNMLSDADSTEISQCLAMAECENIHIEMWMIMIMLHVLHVLPTRYQMQALPKSPSVWPCQSARRINTEMWTSIIVRDRV